MTNGPSTTTTRRKRHRAVIVAIIAAVVAAGVATGFLLNSDDAPARSAVGAPAADTFTMKGAFTLFVAGAKLAEGTPCKGTGAYADMQEGAPVKVFSESGGLLASGELKRGVFVAPQGTTACKFEFAVPGVPDGPLKYAVAIGGHGTKPVTSEVAHSWVFFSDGP